MTLVMSDSSVDISEFSSSEEISEFSSSNDESEIEQLEIIPETDFDELESEEKSLDQDPINIEAEKIKKKHESSLVEFEENPMVEDFILNYKEDQSFTNA